MQANLSVLMSVYNGEKFVKEAVDSILTQTYSDFEFVIVNDGSTDSTAEILASYTDHRLRIFTIENSGLPVALNYGLERCSSKLVMRMDADDVAYPHRFACLLEDWENAGQPDVFGSGADCISEDGKFLWSILMPVESEAVKTAITTPGGPLAIMHPTVLFRKDSVLACGGYDPYFKSSSQDYDLWLRMTTNYRFGNSPQRLLRYRFQSNSDTATAIRTRNKEPYISNWMQLASRQKKIMIDANELEFWNTYRDDIIEIMLCMVDIDSLMDEAIVARRLTEIKILAKLGKKYQVICQLIYLLRLYPVIVTKRVLGITMTDTSKYLLSANTLKSQILLSKGM